MKYFHLVISTVATLTLVIVPVMVADATGTDDSPALRSKVVASLQSLEHLRVQAKKEHISTSLADVTIQTAKLFLKYSQWDRLHPDQLAKNMAQYPKIDLSEARKLAAKLPDQELRGTKKIIVHAMATLRRRMSNDTGRVKVPEFTGRAPIHLNGNYFYSHDRPVFPSSIIWKQGGEKIADAYGAISAISKPLSSLHPDLTMHVSTRRAKKIEKRGGRFFYVYMGSRHPSKWMVKEYSQAFSAGRGHADIDNSHVRILEQAWHKNVASVLANQPGFSHIYMLSNEDYYPTASGKKSAKNGISVFTWEKFRQWLAGRYRHIETLNATWGTRYKSFDQIKIAMPIPVKMQGGPIWYDWCRFNMDRVNDWFLSLIHSTVQNDSRALGSLKLGTYVLSLAPDEGIDWEAVYQMQGIVSIESRPYPVSVAYGAPKGSNLLKKEGYAFKWVADVATLDFITSVAQDKPIWDSEAHGISTTKWRDPNLSADYVRVMLWQTYLHGNGATSLWYWSRRPNGAPVDRARAGFFASLSTQPVALNAYGRTMKQLNAHSRVVTELARAPKQVYIYYTPASVISDVKYTQDKVLSPIVAALSLAGYRVGFVTPSMLEQEQESWNKGQYALDYQYMVLPPTSYASDRAVNLLDAQLKHGAKAVAVGARPLYMLDEHGQKRNKESTSFLKSVPTVQPKSSRKLAGTLSRALASMGLKRAVYAEYVSEDGSKESGDALPVLVRSVKTEDGFFVSLVNVGNKQVRVKLIGQDHLSSDAQDLLEGGTVKIDSLKLPSCGVMLLHVKS